MLGSADKPGLAAYSAFLEHATDLVAILDAMGTVLYTSPSHQRILGYNPEELIGADAFLRVHPDDLSRMRAAFEAALRAEGQPMTGVFRYRHADDSWRMLEVIGTNCLSDPAVRGFIVHSRDVTDQRRIEEERDVLRLRLAAVMEQLPIGIVIAHAPSGRIIARNARIEEIWKHVVPMAEAIEEYPAAYGIFHRDGRPYSPDEYPLARAIRGGEVITEQEVYFHRPDGTPAVASVNAAPIRDGGGQIVAGVLTLIDTTQSGFVERTASTERDHLQRVLDELRILERMRDETLSSLSHDLKNPITSLRGTAQFLHRMIARGDVNQEKLLSRLETMIAVTGTMTRMADELVDVARRRTGQHLNLVREPTDLVELTRTFVDAQQVLARNRIIVAARESEIVAPIDPALFERVLSNLLWNAIKYSGGATPIVVSLWHEDGMVMLSVQDQGIGIPAADLPRIFDRFYRGSNLDATVTGTGVGLASVYQIVEAHGGTVEVQSVEGEGSTFTVVLPLE